MGGLKGLCSFKAKTGGRNNQGRITSFHRGGGAKRLQRKIDLKRNTASMGVVESVEYDPNRSARIALVRWIGDMQFPLKKESKESRKPAPVRKAVDLSAANIRGTFSFSSMSGIRIVDEHQRNKTHPKDVFYSVFSAKGKEPAPLALPRIATAGADPAFVAMRVARQFAGNDSSVDVCEVRKCIPKDSVFWSHRIKPKAALSWHSCKQRETFGLVPPKQPATPPKTVYWVGGK